MYICCDKLVFQVYTRNKEVKEWVEHNAQQRGNNELNFKSFAFQDSVVFPSVQRNWIQHSRLIPDANKIFHSF